MEHRKDALYKVNVQSPAGVLINLQDADYDTAFSAVSALAYSTKDVKLEEYLNHALRHFGFTGVAGYGYSVNVSAYLPKVLSEETHTCGRRSGLGPWEQKENLDRWQIVGKDKVCGFCGSLHPDTVLEIIKEHGIGSLEFSTKPYKWYIKRPDVPNASFGGIKYYRHHDTPEFLQEIQKLLKEKESSGGVF